MTTETRGAYARTNADLTINQPDGFPSEFPPVWWIGSDQLTLNGSWNRGGWNDPLSTQAAPDLAVVTRATSLIVGPLSASPYRVVSDGTIGQPIPSPPWVRDPMLLKPDARIVDSIYPAVLRLSRSAFWGGVVRNALWYGLGAFLYIPDTTGQPLAGTMRLVDPRVPVHDPRRRRCAVLVDQRRRRIPCHVQTATARSCSARPSIALLC